MNLLTPLPSLLLLVPLAATLSAQNSCTYDEGYGHVSDDLHSNDNYDMNDPDETAARGVCQPVATLSCGDQVTADTSDWNAGATDVIDSYPYIVGNYSGPEITYALADDIRGTVTLRFVDPSPSALNHDIFLIHAIDNVCDPVSTSARGFSDLEFEVRPIGTNFIVIDAPTEDQGAFTLQVDCTDEAML